MSNEDKPSVFDAEKGSVGKQFTCTFSPYSPFDPHLLSAITPNLASQTSTIVPSSSSELFV